MRQNLNIHTGTIKINNVALTEFKDCVLPRLLEIQSGLISLRETITQNSGDILLHAATLLNILYPLRTLFGTEAYKNSHQKLRAETTSDRIIASIDLLHLEIDKTFKRDLLVFKPSMAGDKPCAENVWIVMNDIPRTLLSVHMTAPHFDEKHTVMRKTLQCVSESRINVWTYIENINREVCRLLPLGK